MARCGRKLTSANLPLTEARLNSCFRRDASLAVLSLLACGCRADRNATVKITIDVC